MLREAAFYKDLYGYFDWLNGEILRRAQSELASKSALIQDGDFDRLFKIISGQMGQAALEGVAGGSDDLFKMFGFDMDWTGANTDASKWAMQHAGDLVKRIKQTTRDRINTAVSAYVDNAQTFGDLQRSLTDIIRNPQRAATIAQTEITRAFARGNELAWRESGIVQGKEWRTNNDEIVCPICKPLNHQRVALDDSFGVSVFEEPMTAPPAHPNCRCWAVPISTYRKRNG